ncbi:hypothetical protein GW915_12730 [bacterium]|nr:hypothetical protein [bacterium]
MTTKQRKENQALNTKLMISISLISTIVLCLAAMSVEAKKFSVHGGNCDLYEICR